MSRDFHPLGECVIHAIREPPAGDVDVHTGKAVQLDPLRIADDGMVVDFVDDDRRVVGKRAGVESGEADGDGEEETEEFQMVGKAASAVVGCSYAQKRPRANVSPPANRGLSVEARA